MKFSQIILLLIIGFDLSADVISLNQTQKESYGIKTEQVKQINTVLSLPYPAKVVVPNTQLQVLSALQGGLVEALMAAEGDYVEEGQMLARIQSPGMLELQRDLLQTLTRLGLAQSTLNRDKQLLDEGIIPERRYLESRSVWEALVTEKQQLEASLLFSGMDSSAISELESKRKLNSALILTAPFNGVLLEQMVIPGQKLEAADPLFQIGKLSPLWLEIHVPVDVVYQVDIGDAIVVSDFNIRGEIITIGRKVHEIDQGTLVRAVVKENIEYLRPGQIIQAQLSASSNNSNRYLVPPKAIVRVNNKSIIFVESEEGYFAVNIDIIGNRKGEQIITTPEKITSPVVVSGTVSLKAILTGAGGEG